MLSGYPSNVRSRPILKTGSWLDFLTENPNGNAEHFLARVMGRQFDEIAPVFGEDPNNVLELMMWGRANLEARKLATIIYNDLYPDGEEGDDEE
jgi:hypothetical protein